MRAFVSRHLDYCNSLLCHVSDELLQKLEVIQNVAGSQEVRSHHPGASRTPLAAHSPLHQVQAGDDHLQVPPQVDATISGRRLCTGLVCG